MQYAAVYLLIRFIYRPVVFFRHWYVDGSRAFGHAFISTLEKLDETIAIRITLKYFFQPLYKDFSIVGRILGVIFRTGRIAIGTVVYAAVIAIFVAAYLFWLGIPPLILSYVIRNI
jgi:hypothetical protein